MDDLILACIQYEVLEVIHTNIIVLVLEGHMLSNGLIEILFITISSLQKAAYFSKTALNRIENVRGNLL